MGAQPSTPRRPRPGHSPGPLQAKQSNPGPWVVGIVAILVVGVGAVVLMNAGTSRHPAATARVSNKSELPKAGTTGQVAPQKNDGGARQRKQAVDAFFIEHGYRIESIGKSRNTISAADRSLADSLASVAQIHRTKADELSKTEASAAIELARLKDQEIELQKTVDAYSADLDKLHNAQSPLSGYLAGYREYAETIDQHREIHEKVDQADSAVAACSTAFWDQRDRVADLEALAEASMDVDERTSAQMALDSSRQKLQELQLAWDKAREDQAVLAAKLVLSFKALSTAADQLSVRRTALNPKDSATSALLAVIEKYEAALLEQVKAMKALDEVKKKQQGHDRGTAVPIGDYRAAKERYLEAHGEYLEAKRQTSRLEEQYKNDVIRGESAKEAIRRAKAREDALKGPAEEAKKELVSITKRLTEASQKDRTLSKEVQTAQKAVDQATANLAPARRELAGAIDSALKKLGPEEEKRLKEVEGANAKLAQAKSRLAEASEEAQRKSSALERLTRDRLAAEASARSVEGASDSRVVQELLGVMDLALAKIEEVRGAYSTEATDALRVALDNLESELERAVLDDTLAVNASDKSMRELQAARRTAIVATRKHVATLANSWRELKKELGRQ